MNYCIPMPDGSLHAMTAHDAELLASFLHERMTHGPESDQKATLRMLQHLEIAMSPESHFSDIYGPTKQMAKAT